MISEEGWSPTRTRILWESETERSRSSVAGEEKVATLIIETKQVSLFRPRALRKVQTLRSREPEKPRALGSLTLGIGGALVVNRGSLMAWFLTSDCIGTHSVSIYGQWGLVTGCDTPSSNCTNFLTVHWLHFPLDRDLI